MNWDAIGAVGEVAGALGVMITLAYLATQIRQSQISQRRQGFRDGLTELLRSTDRIGDYAPLYNRGCADFQGLDEDERLQFHTVIARKYAAIELFHDFHKSGDTKIEAIERLNGWVLDDFRGAGVRQWWDAVGRDTYSRDFSREIDRLVRELIQQPPETDFQRTGGF